MCRQCVKRQRQGAHLFGNSNDDALHADGKAAVLDGSVRVLQSYEGIEGRTIEIAGGNVSVISSDDGLNGTVTSGTGITISGGTLYVLAGGDGADANSQTSYGGILFSGGYSVIISTGKSDSSIDSERGYNTAADMFWESGFPAVWAVRLPIARALLPMGRRQHFP